jgi:hypothetical protein
MLRMVAVVGNGEVDPERDATAEAIGAEIAEAGFGLVCGGLGGVMEAACRGAHAVLGPGSGRILALLPGTDRALANPYADIVVPTGLGYARNILVVLSADAVVAIGGGSGTLSEIAHAWQLDRPICAVAGAGGWASELAGKTLDGRRTDRIHGARDAAEVGAWLRATLPPA